MKTNSLTKRDLLDFLFLVELVYNENEQERETLIRNALENACALGIREEFMEKLTEIRKAKEREEEEKKKLLEFSERNTNLDLDRNGCVRKTIDNYLVILRNDDHFASLMLNELTGRGEYEGKPITDGVKSDFLHHIEKIYSLKSERDFDHALAILLKERQYHPIRDAIAKLKWDGKSRIDSFLRRIMGAEDDDYTRECSRLIFHCGIARVMKPGCKVDDVIILQGVQGNGKSTLVSWLALNEDWYGRVNDIRGNTGIEQIQGKWVCEISELIAVSGKERQEEAKQYLDRKSDNYRRPYAQYSEDIPRQCIFIGTTNLRQPFSDRTGNRRYYPVWCNIKPGELYDHESSVKAYIAQCWAEAYELWQRGEIRHAVKKEMFYLVCEKQKNALEDDWREGVIESYLKDKTDVCIIQVWTEALGMTDKPTRKQSKEIGALLNSFNQWERMDGVKLFDGYKNQRYWHKKDTAALVPMDNGYSEVVDI